MTAVLSSAGMVDRQDELPRRAFSLQPAPCDFGCVRLMLLEECFVSILHK